MRRAYWVMVLVVLAAALLLSARSEAAVPRVASYRPPTVAPGADVAMHGSDFGTRKPQHTIRYGTGASPLGEAEIRGWTRTRIDVRLPATIPPGRYWLAIYERDALKSNQLRGLTVETSGTPADPPPGSRPLSTQKVLPGVRMDPPRADEAPFRRTLDLGPFRADKIGTGIRRYTQTPEIPDCPDATWEIFEPRSGGAYTGYAKYWDPDIGATGLGCWNTTYRLYRGMVRFDVRKLRGKTIARADLIFRATVVLDENDSSVCTRKPIAKMMILDRQFRAGMGGGWIDGGADSSSPVGVLTGGQIKTDVTHLVTRWANGDLRNHGVVFIGRDETPFHSNNKCVVRMSDFKLDVDYHD